MTEYDSVGLSKEPGRQPGESDRDFEARLQQVKAAAAEVGQFLLAGEAEFNRNQAPQQPEQS